MNMIYLAIWTHWFADFVLQTHKQATNKSTSIYWLTQHILVYTIVLGLVLGPKYALVNGLAHWITDFFTSKATKKLWEKKDVHNFFAVIGLDQAIHLTCLVVTLPLAVWPW